MIAVMGPTGSGKSDLAEDLAVRLDAVLVNADAFQVYRWLDIGTNKPEDKGLYELIDICEPEEQFGLGEWLRLVEEILQTAWTNERSVVFVGGTGLYIRALFEGYAEMSGAPDAELRAELMRREEEEGLGALVEELKRLDFERAEKVDLQNPVRVRRALEKILGGGEVIKIDVPGFKKRKFGLYVEKELHKEILENRLKMMVESGWIEEVRELNDLRIPESAPAMRAIGYHTWRKFLSGATTFDEAMAEVLTLTVQYAKRQRTWIRKEPGLLEIAIDPNEAGSRKAALAAVWSSIVDLSG